LPLLSINYDSPREIRSFLDSRNLGMRKKFGQNFLINPRIRARLLSALETQDGDEVWEIGPGLGAMTTGLLDQGARVTAFEIDPAFSGALRELFGYNESFRLIEGDVLKTWPAAAASFTTASAEASEKGGVSCPCRMPLLLGNLPYNIAAVLLADFIEKKWYFPRIVVTVQKEVALRMAALRGTKTYSSFSVLCASVYRTVPLAAIKGSSFYPPPRVDSQALRLELLPEKDRKNRSSLFHPLVRALFSSRRKTIRNNMLFFVSSCIVKVPAEDAADEAFRRCGLSGNLRAENLSVEDFAALAEAVESISSYGL
jgi:16S rRNA (adenine1518-N6/adenine1519-N6)-dimethyltransferase